MEKDIKQFNIVHLDIDSPFMDDSGYQETLLAKYHKIMCNQVTIITTNLVMEKSGEVSSCDKLVYYNKDGVKIIRLRCFSNKRHRVNQRSNIFRILCDEKPDFVMVHGIQSFDTWAIVLYKRRINHKCIIIADSHTTLENQNPYTIKDIIFRLFLIPYNRIFSYYCNRLYGITPGAVEFMIKYFGMPRRKTQFLGLGYDNDLIDQKHREEIRTQIRKKNGIATDSYVLIHGGKMNEGKKTVELIKCMKFLPDNLSLIIFGEFCSDSYKTRVMKEIENSSYQILYLGYLQQKEIYNYFLASDLAVFPGTATVLRQQAVASGLPVVVCVDNKENCINLNLDTNAIYLRPQWNMSNLVDAILNIYKDYTYFERAIKLSMGEYMQYSYESQAKELIISNM